ncbi:hypothetical protein AVEN_133675-1 [Araneus ventricosus]|uniref:HAT C-terminal dimerisation domain-containing protein n=1 Tax=Araneus ventricosus TaxID=182803 RepID=A0A4Y2B7H0_ARAVE|nr:hypothetical protein AVEN_133675-1 [Araneus ventricosus]
MRTVADWRGCQLARWASGWPLRLLWVLPHRFCRPGLKISTFAGDAFPCNYHAMIPVSTGFENVIFADNAFFAHADLVKEEFVGFYVRCIAYLDLWENSFGKTLQFAWVNLTKTNAVDWENAETSAEIINSSFLDVPDLKINSDEVFDEVVLAKEYLQSNWEQWKQEETTRYVIISSEEKCLRLFGHFKENHIAAPNLIKIFEYAFCLPGTSAPVEKVFSLMNNA